MRDHNLQMTSLVILKRNPIFQINKQNKYHNIIKNVVTTPLS